MTIQWPGNGQPDSSVSSDSNAQLSQGIQVLVSKFNSLERVIATQTAMMERTYSAGSRYQMGNQPQLRQDIIQGVVAAGGSAHGARTTQVSGMGAMASLGNMQGFLAQRLGQWIAGTPLFEQPQQAPQATAGMNVPAGQTVTGQGVPGARAQQAGQNTPVAAQQTQAGQGGGGAGAGGGGGAGAPPGAPPPGPPGGGGPPGGLPGLLFGTGRHAAQGQGAQTTTAMLRQIGARVAMGGGGGLSTITNVLRAIPGVGLAMDLAGGGANFLLNQREAGRVYQGIEGGTNVGAQAERLHAMAFQLSMFGRMPAGAAAQAFGIATGLGYNMGNSQALGAQMQNRGSALGFIYNNYANSGMDVNQSAQFLQVASQNANVNLGQLATTIENLSSVAGQAGTSADTARQQLLSYFQTALTNGAGNGAQTIAGGVASMQASLGKEFAGTNFSGDLTQQRQYLLSGMSGISPSQLQYIARNNPTGYLTLLAGQNTQFLTSGGLMTPQMTASMQQMIRQSGGAQAFMTDPTLASQVAQQFLNQWQLKGNINQSLWAQELSGLTGNNLTPSNVVQWIVNQVAGVNEASHNTSMAGPSGASVSANNIPGGTPTGQYGLAVKTLKVHGGRGDTLGGRDVRSWQDVLTHDNSAAAAPYLASVTRSGQRSPVLEAILQNAGSGDQVAVQTSSGTRVMSLAQAMQYYPNELASGNVTFYNSSGTPLGNTGSITQGLTNPNASVAAEEKQKAGSSLGQTIAAYQKAHAASQEVPTGGGQSVTVTLSSEAQQLLKLLPANNDQAAAMSSVPANPYVSQASR